MRLLVLVPVFSHLLGTPAPTAGGDWDGPPFTLRPDPLRVGETLVCIIGSGLHERPDRASSARDVGSPGDSVAVTGWATVAGVSWIRTRGGWVEAARVDRPAPPTEEELPVGQERMARGRIIPANWRPSDLREVPDSLKAPGLKWREMSLREGALDAFGVMIAAAAADGVRIGLVSAYRSVEYQRPLYRRAVERDPRQVGTAAPGRSEHHLGTTADVATPGVPILRAELADSAAGRWLERHAGRFGIVATYSRCRHAARGVAHEPWHLRWVGENTADEEAW